jgi:RHS repeat-associated protein
MVTNASLQPYKYNGKELDLMHGLNTYDYGARQYYSIVGRWDRVDPLCEKDYPTSPYVFCGNNPVNRIDKDGRIWDTVLDLAFVAYDAAEAAYQYCTTGHVSNTTKAALGADALAAAVPGLTGTGLAVRTGAKATGAGHGLKYAKEMAEGLAFEKTEFAAAKASGEKVASHIRLVPQNGIGNVSKNRSTVNQLFHKKNGNYKIRETKLREGSSKLSTGQRRTRKNVVDGNQTFEVRSDNKDLGLRKGQTIKVDEYEIKYKYNKEK